MKVLALLLSLTLLVATHEFGHLLLAKLFHTRVRRYYIFFNWGFSLVKLKKFGGKWHVLFFNSKTPDSWDEKNLAPEDQNNTLWGLGWLPFGGYCDIAGMVDETKSSSDLESEPQPWEYRSKPAWQRLLIISGGIIVNFLTAMILYGAIFAHWGSDELPMRSASLGYDYHQILLDEGFCNGDVIYSIDGKEYFDMTEASKALLLDNPSLVRVLRADSLVDISLSGDLAARVNHEQPRQLMSPRMPFIVKSFPAGSNAKSAGIMEGDSIVGVGDSALAAYSDIVRYFGRHSDQDVSLSFYRDGQIQTLPVHVDENGKIGVMAETDIARLFPAYRHISYTILEAIPAGISQGWSTLVTYVSSLKMLFAPEGVKNLGGFITMGSIFPSYWDWYSFWNITALLAMVLAFMNIIPIPGLDGGHIVFTLWEMISGKKPSDKFLDVVQTIGMVLLLALMVLANGNDILRLLHII